MTAAAVVVEDAQAAESHKHVTSNCRCAGEILAATYSHRRHGNRVNKRIFVPNFLFSKEEFGCYGQKPKRMKISNNKADFGHI